MKKLKSLSQISPAFYDVNANKTIDIMRMAQENANAYGEPVEVYQTNHDKALRATSYIGGKWKGQALLEIVHPSSKALRKMNKELVA